MSEMNIPFRRPNLVSVGGQPIGATADSERARWGFDPEDDLKATIFTELGPLDDIELFHNDVLVWKYIRRNVSESILASHETQNADRWEGVTGLVLKLGPAAFVDDDRNKFWGCKVAVGDWALFRNNDGWDKGIMILGNEPRQAMCRILQDAHIRGRVKFPARIY